MLEILADVFDTSAWPPRWKCGHWSPAQGYLHIFSDIGVGTAYVAIPIVLGYFALRRRDLPFQRIFWLFVLFILACGSTHFMDATIFYWPAYNLAGLIKLATAIVSWGTVLALVPIVPQALSLRSPRELEREIAERERAEEALRDAHSELEQRVAERTADLAAVNAALRDEVHERHKTEEQLREVLADRERLLGETESARDDAEAANRVKDEFLANLSHELRTPLNAILGWAQLLRANQCPAEEISQGLETIERNARVQARIIEDLLDVSRIMSGKLRLDVHAVKPLDVIEDALASIKPAADAKGIRLEPVLDPSAGPVAGDSARLQQVVWNLLSNAVKFTPSGGKVQVHLARVNSHIEIAVSDTGQGIHEEFLPFIFDRFRQYDSSTTRRVGGLGLGLSIVRQIVELHGGSVHARSPGISQGATFVVKLPVTAVRAAPGDEPREHPRLALTSTTAVLASLSGVKALVVDDEIDARELIERVLANAGAEVKTAGSVVAALETLQSWGPDVIVTDIGMPEQDGFDLLRQIRQDSQFGALPSIALTAFARSEDRQRALLAGFQQHLAKPVDAAELTVVVASLTGRLGSTG